MSELSALIIPPSTVQSPNDAKAGSTEELAAIRSARGVISARRYRLAEEQRFPGPYPEYFTVCRLRDEAGARDWAVTRKTSPLYKGSVAGVMESLRPRAGEPADAKVTHMMIAMTTPKPGRDDEYNQWYWDRHMPDGQKLPGIISAERFRLRPDLSDAGFPYEYMALYDIRMDDLQVQIDRTNKISRTPEMPVSESLLTGYAWYVTPTEE